MKDTSRVSPVMLQILLPRSSKKRYADSFRGGATVLKVGDKFCEKSEQKIFDPHFLVSGGQNILLR